MAHLATKDDSINFRIAIRVVKVHWEDNSCSCAGVAVHPVGMAITSVWHVRQDQCTNGEFAVAAMPHWTSNRYTGMSSK